MTLYQHDRASMFRFEIRGELCGSVLRELEGCWETAMPTFGPRRVVVDLTGVTSWDDSGLELICRFRAAGAEVEGGALGRLIAGGEAGPQSASNKMEPRLLQRIHHWFAPRALAAAANATEPRPKRAVSGI
jgi:hypothetical protein